jgi:hypothetical protein
MSNERKLKMGSISTAYRKVKPAPLAAERGRRELFSANNGHVKMIV